MRHVHTHMHTYTHTHLHKHITIDTYTRHMCRGFRACPNGCVHHDSAVVTLQQWSMQQWLRRLVHTELETLNSIPDC